MTSELVNPQEICPPKRHRLLRLLRLRLKIALRCTSRLPRPPRLLLPVRCTNHPLGHPLVILPKQGKKFANL
jgi:hypothetical protein